jgi:hypothetical protein
VARPEFTVFEPSPWLVPRHRKRWLAIINISAASMASEITTVRPLDEFLDEDTTKAPDLLGLVDFEAPPPLPRKWFAKRRKFRILASCWRNAIDQSRKSLRD